MNSEYHGQEVCTSVAHMFINSNSLLEKLIINHFTDKSLSQKSYGIFIDLKNTLGQENSSNVEHLSSM